MFGKLFGKKKTPADPAREALLMGKDAIDPGLGLRIVMECAIPMSKIDPAGFAPAQQ